MARHDRLRAAFRGDPVDRVPVSLWQHFPGQDHNADVLAEATVAYQRRFDLDFVKLMPTGMYCVMDYGVKVVPSGDEIGTTRFAAGPIHQPEDWGRLPPIAPDSGVLGEQVRAVRLIRGALGDGVPILQTIFSPLTVAAKLAGQDLEPILRTSEPWLRRALDRLSGDVVTFGEACLDAGADGFFFAAQLATRTALPEGTYERFGVPYDLQVLAALRPRAWGMLLHLHGTEPLFDLADRYSIDGVNWHARETEPSLAAAVSRTGRGLVGGIARTGPAKTGPPKRAAAEAREAIVQTGGRRLVIAPSCVLPTTAAAENLMAIRRAVEE